MDDAVKEIKEINRTINKLETEFSTEMQREIKPVRQFYEAKMRKIYDQQNKPKSMYETDNDYKNRRARFDRQLTEIKSEMNQKISDIRQNLNNALHQQKKPLLNQREDVTKQVFPIGLGNVSFKIVFYDAEKEKFGISLKITEKKYTTNVFAFLPIPKSKAVQYGQHPELLVPDINFRLNEKAKFIPDKFSFSGPEKDKYVCKTIIIGIKGIPKYNKGRLIVFDNGTVLDTKTRLLWATQDNGRDIIGITQKDIAKIIKVGDIMIGECLELVNWKNYIRRVITMLLK
ncbi:hypothetical protein MHK_006655, partial [Candidatus Magnetomorum sp. HK-1]